MPQLHDSSNRQQRTSSLYYQSYARIFGLETEYGLSLTHTQRPIDIGQVAMMMFQPIVQRERSTNTYLSNGSRLYLDVGSHPEYATAEACTPYDAVLADAVGESVIRTMALDTQTRLQAHNESEALIHVFKNNADSAHHSYGCHENYLVRRNVDLQHISTQLLPFLITRQIYTGAGRFDSDQWTYTQRAQFVDETVSSATTRSRPMINTRDEPHADPDSFRRLHVIIGDSNRSQWATMMKCATTHLVLCVMEWSAQSKTSNQLSRLAMADPVAANLAVNAYGPQARIELANGTHMSALEMQELALHTVHNFLGQHGEEVTQSLQFDPLCTPAYIVEQWQWAINNLRNNNIDAMAQVMDWACKLRFFERLRSRGALDTLRQAQLDFDYHDIANGRLYPSLVKRGLVKELITQQQVERAVDTPPQHTRAVLRGQFVQLAQQAGLHYACDWTQLQLTTPVRETVQILDPFDSSGGAQYRNMIDIIRHHTHTV